MRDSLLSPDSIVGLASMLSYSFPAKGKRVVGTGDDDDPDETHEGNV